MLRMKPIDMLFTAPNTTNISRVSLVCRGEESVVAESGDDWIGEPWVWKDMAAVGLDYAALKSSAPPVGYRALNPGLVFRPGTDCIDPCATIKVTPPNRGSKAEGELYLSDMA